MSKFDMFENYVIAVKPKNFTQNIKHQNDPMVWDSAYRIGNFVMDPKTWIYGTAGVEIINETFNPSTPPESFKGKIGAIIYDYFKEDSSIGEFLGVKNEH